MKSFVRILVIILCICFTPLLRGAELPRLTDASLAEHVVYLPGDMEVASRLCFQWNAALSTEVHLYQHMIPTVAEVYPRTKPEFTAWRDEALATWYAHHKSSATFAFLVDEKQPHICVLPVLHETLAKRLQLFVDNTLRAQGAVIPRPYEHQVHGIHVEHAVDAIVRSSGFAQLHWKNYVMIVVALSLLYLAIVKGFEPLLLVPISIGCLLVNAAGAGMGEPGGMLYVLYQVGIETSLFPLLIFLGVGALTDFGPLLANPWSALLGGAAQFGIFGSFFLAVLCFGFSMQEAGAIAIIGGADGPTSIFVASKLAPDLLGAIAVSAYSYMALVPLIQPPVMRLLTTDKERKIMMTQRRQVSRRARILFPITVILLCMLTLPDAVPLIGMLMFGNILKESGVVDRLSKAAQNELINIVTIGLGLSVGMKMSADYFLVPQTLGIMVIGIVAFMLGTAAGVLLAKLLNAVTGGRVNPLIGAAGVSAVPMAARVAHAEGQRYNKQNALLMHAMGPNVAGVIGSAVAAGILLSLLA